MRTTDFSAAPRRAQGNALFLGSTKYNGLRQWITLYRTWRPFVRRMEATPGYCWHKVYYQPPFTLGTIAVFATRDDMLAMARSPEHRKLMQRVADGSTDQATGGFIRLFNAEPQGYTNGIWRAEDRSMQHIENFARLPGDTDDRRVDDPGSEIR